MKIMVITGASSGVGKATAIRFAKEGYQVCALSRNREKLEVLEQESSGIIQAYQTDVSDSNSVEETFTKIIDDHGKIDVLVNNAGVTSGGKAVDNELIDRIIDTNLKGAIYCTYATIPSMKESGAGHIVNIASIAGVDIAHKGNDGLYAASKHGMVAFSESIGKKIRREGILVTALCPGGIDTPLWNDENPYPNDKGEMIRPEEVADLIAYVLAQPKRTLFKNVIFVPVVEQW
jgi:NAD(P)-dependent dehydrogenase (short-subunit alcohol dehydrogenase family)